uniref:Uncharacterized protein n=1 Tax=Arundo donax TaxID=35708 RepID=A0A0A9H848_ARUDO
MAVVKMAALNPIMQRLLVFSSSLIQIIPDQSREGRTRENERGRQLAQDC